MSGKGNLMLTPRPPDGLITVINKRSKKMNKKLKVLKKQKTRKEICGDCRKLCLKMVDSRLYCEILGKYGLDKRDY